MEGDKEVLVKKSSRRAHRKSRTGCSNCKARKVKCDEAKPQCAQCIRHSMHCSFMPAPNSTNDPAPLVFSKRFIPSRYQDRVTGTPASSRKASPQAESSPDTTSSSTTYQNFSQLPVADLELLYNFMTSTRRTFGDDTDSVTFWEKKVVEVGFSYEFVLHLVLAFSALHLADSRPDRQAVYFSQAERHYYTALQAVTALLSQVNAQNYHALFVSSMLIAFYHFGKGPQPGDFLAFSEHGEPEWPVLLGGVRTIIESANDVLPADTSARPASHNGSPYSSPLKGEAQPAYKKPIQDLRQFIEDKRAANDPHAKTCLEALESLSRNFAAIYGDTEYEDDGYSHLIFRWLYCASDSFSRCLQQKQPLALIIFAYFTSLMQIYESQWFIRPWIGHIMTGIWRFLPADYRPWIQWPIEQIKWVSPIDSELSIHVIEAS